jgi:hypothetical protein
LPGVTSSTFEDDCAGHHFVCAARRAWTVLREQSRAAPYQFSVVSCQFRTAPGWNLPLFSF